MGSTAYCFCPHCILPPALLCNFYFFNSSGSCQWLFRGESKHAYLYMYLICDFKYVLVGVCVVWMCVCMPECVVWIHVCMVWISMCGHAWVWCECVCACLRVCVWCECICACLGVWCPCLSVCACTSRPAMCRQIKEVILSHALWWTV